MISPSPLPVDIKPNQTNTGRAGENTSNIHRDTGKQLIAKTDGPELAANGQLKINGVGNNLAKDGPISGDGNNKATDGPQNGDGNNKATDGPTSGVGNNKATDGPKIETNGDETKKTYLEELATKWKKLSEKYLLPLTTHVSVGFNLVSAAIRLLGKENPIVKLLNKLSVWFTRIHQVGYSVTGLGMALCKKNLFYVLSFGLEGLVALMPLRSIYLLKGLASALDIVPSCIEKYTSDRFKQFSESLGKTWNGITKTVQEAIKNPQLLLTKDSLDKQWPIFGAALSILGNIVGFSGADTIGGGIRDIGAILNDFGLLFKNNATAKRSGKFYMGGSVIDLAANGVGRYGQSKGSSNGFFGNLRDALHEVALASDRMGQKYFIHYNTEKDLEHDKAALAKKQKINLHSNEEQSFAA